MMTMWRVRLGKGRVVATAVLLTVWCAPGSRAQPAPHPPAIAGAWVLNADLSDKPGSGLPGDDNGGRGRAGGRMGGPGGGGGFGGPGRGGFGGGMRGGGAPGPQSGGMSQEDRQRLRDAMRDLVNAPDRLTIAEADSQMILVTGGDGRVTRLSTDGRKIRDESTKAERKTRWDGEKLVSEITGLGPGKVTETYAIEPRHHVLIVTVDMEQPRMAIRHVYDPAGAR